MRVNITEYGPNRVEEIEIHPFDTWNMDQTLALIIHPMLVQLKETNHGYPSGQTEESWNEIQDKMIWSFKQIIDESEWDVPRSQWRSHNAKIQDGLDLFGKWYRHLWD